MLGFLSCSQMQMQTLTVDRAVMLSAMLGCICGSREIAFYYWMVALLPYIH